MRYPRLLQFIAGLLMLLQVAPVMAEPKKATTPAGARRIPICVRLSPGQRAWSITSGGSLVMASESDFNARAGEVIYVFDEKAPKENVKYLPIKYKNLRCPGDTRTTAPSAGTNPPTAGSASGSAGSSGGSGQTTSGSGRSGQGSGTTGGGSGSGSGSGGSAQNDAEVARVFNPSHVPTWIDRVAQNMIIFGSFVSGRTGETLRHPQGVQGGMPGGKNIGGPDMALLQLGVGAAMVVVGVVLSVATFEQKLTEAGAKRVPLIVEKEVITKDIAEELAKKYGDVLPNALRQVQTIVPYDVAQALTKGYGHVFEAHHIFEVAMMKQLGVEGAERAPAVILLKGDHRALTAKLDAERAALLADKTKELTRETMWEIYQKVYASTPHYLDAIRPYFGK